MQQPSSTYESNSFAKLGYISESLIVHVLSGRFPKNVIELARFALDIAWLFYSFKPMEQPSSTYKSNSFAKLDCISESLILHILPDDFRKMELN